MREMKWERALGRTLQKRQGAALIAVLLLTMVLSGIGVVAVQNTFNSMELAGNYRLRRQAQESANASLVLVGTRVGDSAERFFRRLRPLGKPDPDDYFVFEGTKIKAEFFPNAAGRESGLFQNPDDVASTPSFESDASLGDIRFDVVMRDPIEGPPPPGFSADVYCSKQVYLASRTTYDSFETGTGSGVQTKANWERPARAAAGIVGMVAWLEPIQNCAY